MRSVVRASMVTVAAGVAALTIAACGAGAANGPAPVVQPANSTFSTNVPTTVVVPPPQSPLTTNPAPVAPAVPTTRGRGVEPGDDHGGNCALEPNDDRCLRAGAGGAGANGAGATRGREAEPGDDHGGNCALEPGDDRCAGASAGVGAGEPGDDHGDRDAERGDDHGGDRHGDRGRGGDDHGDDHGGRDGGHHDG